MREGNLAWTKIGEQWVATSHNGAVVRIYPYQGRKDVFAVEGRFGDKTYASATDAANAIAMSSTPTKTRRQILDSMKRSAEGYVLRYETTGIQDPLEANQSILRMNSLVWRRLLNEWRLKNPEMKRPAAPKSVRPEIEERRTVYLRFLIDTNRINSRQTLPAMNMLEEWQRRGVIEILLPETVADEAARGENQIRRMKVRSFIHTLDDVETDAERERRQRIAELLFPNGTKDQTQLNDAGIVFNADKYGGILITADGGSRRQPGGILGAREGLHALGVRVLTDVEACTLVETRIRERDERARRDAVETGLPVPRWVGADHLQNTDDHCTTVRPPTAP